MSDKKSMKQIEEERLITVQNYGGRHFVNMLDEMMRLQKQFASKFCDFDKLSFEEQEKWTKEYIICCFDELSEILNWTNWKHWSKNKKQYEQYEIKYEIIDLLHFVLDLALVWRMTPEELFSMYVAKNRENFKRQQNNY